MCDHIVRRASNVFDPPPFTDVELLGFALLSDNFYIILLCVVILNITLLSTVA